MLVLGIESSCDETAGAIVEEGCRVLSNVVASQEALHRKFGGVVPELASRAHVERLVPVLDETVRRAGVSLSQVDAVAVTNSPGLIGALLTGLTAAKTLALVLGRPLVAVNHVYAHCYAIHLVDDERGESEQCKATRQLAASPSPDAQTRAPEQRPTASYPLISLIVSGGHTAIFLCRSVTDVELLGSTTDDAAGEAFDKVAKILGLGYPGGPAIERAARGGSRSAVRFPRSFGDADDLDFSFSGIKTAVLYHCRGQDARSTEPLGLSPERIADIAASFQEAVVEVLVTKTFRAAELCRLRQVVVGGGVACNNRLREAFLERAAGRFEVLFPAKKYCTDNAAMVAGLGYHLLKTGAPAPLDVDAIPQLLRSTA